MMKMPKPVLLLLTGVVLITGLFYVYKNYPRFEVEKANRQIDVSGVALGMTRDELESVLGTRGVFLQGMGGYGLEFPSLGLFISISDHGMFSDRVTQIQTSNKLHSMLGARVGGTREGAAAELKKRGYIEINDLFEKGNIRVLVIAGGETVDALRILFDDPAYRNIVF